MLIIQNGYECDYEMKLFYKLYFDMNEDIYVYSNSSLRKTAFRVSVRKTASPPVNGLLIII